MPRRYDKSELRAEANMAKMSTDKLRKELGLRKERVEIAGWSRPYEVLIKQGKPVKTEIVNQPKPKQVVNTNVGKKPPFKPKFKEKFKKAF
jgi:serine protease inhibitor ecotin